MYRIRKIPMTHIPTLEDQLSLWHIDYGLKVIQIACPHLQHLPTYQLLPMIFFNFQPTVLKSQEKGSSISAADILEFIRVCKVLQAFTFLNNSGLFYDFQKQVRSGTDTVFCYCYYGLEGSIGKQTFFSLQNSKLSCRRIYGNVSSPPYEELNYVFQLISYRSPQFYWALKSPAYRL